MFAGPRYGRVAALYDSLELLLGGTLERTRNAFLGKLPFAPANPLILACGTGKFPAAYILSEQPARLTVNDMAPEMIAVAHRRIAATGWKGQLDTLEGDLSRFHLRPVYDFVAAQFFLDCFPQRSRIPLLRKMREFMSPGAVLLVSGYARPRSRWMLPLFYLNHSAASLGFWMLGAQAPNPPGDIERAIVDSGFTILEKRTFFAGLFASWLAR